MKQIVMETKLLTNAAKGEYTITTYYSDCTYEERKAPLGPIIIPTNIDLGTNVYTPPPEAPELSQVQLIVYIIACTAVLLVGVPSLWRVIRYLLS